MNSIMVLYIGAYAGHGSYTEGVKRTHITDLHCDGTENNVLSCSYNIINNVCGTYQDAYVQCQGQNHIVCIVFILIYSSSYY